jgi:hypothetical protein
MWREIELGIHILEKDNKRAMVVESDGGSYMLFIWNSEECEWMEMVRECESVAEARELISGFPGFK